MVSPVDSSLNSKFMTGLSKSEKKSFDSAKKKEEERVARGLFCRMSYLYRELSRLARASKQLQNNIRLPIKPCPDGQSILVAWILFSSSDKKFAIRPATAQNVLGNWRIIPKVLR